MQSGFKPKLWAIYYICIWRRLQKKCLKEGLVTRIVDFEKAFKRIAMDIMDIVWSILTNLCIEEWLIRYAESIHINAWSRHGVNGSIINDILAQVGFSFKHSFIYHSNWSIIFRNEIKIPGINILSW